jgi:hypothetical protein
MQVAQLLPQVCDEQFPPTSHYALAEGARRGDKKMRKMLILLALVVLTTANTGCCARFRNFCHRGSPCGTTIVAQPAVCVPATIGIPAPAPQVAPVMAPVMAPAPMQQVIAPQPIYCCPQPVPCCPQPVPCYPPNFFDPCQAGMMVPFESGGVTTYDDGYLAPELVPETDAAVDAETFKADPGPAGEN